MYTNRLKEIRETLNINQKEIANILGISRQTYSEWETLKNFIPLKHLNNYCNIFDFSMDYVMQLTNKNIKYSKIKELNKIYIGNKLRNFRKNENISSRELADKLKCAYSTINAYERGEYLILTSLLFELCKKYNLSMDEFCGRTK